MQRQDIIPRPDAKNIGHHFELEERRLGRRLTRVERRRLLYHRQTMRWISRAK